MHLYQYRQRSFLRVLITNIDSHIIFIFIFLSVNENTHHIKSKRRSEFYYHFERLAPDLRKYRKRYAYFWNDIVRYCNYFIHEDDSVLEVGCATGEMLAKMKGKNKTGIDFSPKMIEIARDNYAEIDFYLDDAEKITLNDTYDTIVLSHVTGYFVDVLKVFSSLRNLCHPRTRIIINYYNFLWEPLLLFGELIGIKRKSPKQNWLTKKDLQTFLYIAGYETYRSTKRVLLPINIPVVSWILNKFIARLPLINQFCLNQYLFARPLVSLDKSEVVFQKSPLQKGSVYAQSDRLMHRQP